MILRSVIPLIFLIFLSTAALAVAGEILGVTIQGNDAVPGFAKENDQISTIVTARLSEGIPITPQKLERRYYWSSTRYTAEPFTACAPHPGTNIFDCSMASSTATLPQGRIQFTIALFSDEQKSDLAAQRDAAVIVDTTPPAVRSLSVQGLNNNITNGQLTFMVAVQDNPLLCAGVGDLVFTVDGKEMSKTIHSDTLCQKTIEVPIDLTHLTSGAHRICVLPEDRVENRAAESKEGCINLRLDTQAPTCSISLSSSRGSTVYYGALPHPVTVTLRSTDNIAGLAGMLSRGVFTEMTGEQTPVVPDSCTFDGAAWLCIWNSVVNTRESGFSIALQAIDDVGNQASASCSKSYTLQQDTTAPVIESIVVENSNTHLQGWISRDENNTIIATIAEAESGIKEIFADFSRTDLSVGNPIRAPTKSLGTVFIWENISCNGCTASPKEVTIRGTDYTGNQFSRTVTFPTDFIPPIISGTKFESGGDKKNFIVNGDIVVIDVRWSDAESGARLIKADLTDLKEKNVLPNNQQGRFVQEGTCNMEQKTCTIRSNAVGGPLTAAIPVWIIDAANNVARATVAIEVLQSSTVPSQYWRVKPGSITVSPEQIDREITDLIEMPLYLRFQLEENGNFASCSNFRILDIGHKTCSTQPANFAAVLGSRRIVAPQLIAVSGTPGDRESSLITSLFTLQPGAVDNSMLSPQLSANISCDFQITTRCGTQSSIEDHEVLVLVQYFNNPIGTLDASVTQEIANVKNSFLVKTEWITKVRNYLDYFKRTCSLIRAVTVAGQAISAINGGWLDPLRGIPFVNIIPVAIAGADAGTNKITQGIYLAFNKGCKVVSCEWSYSHQWKDWGENLLDQGNVAGILGFKDTTDTVAPISKNAPAEFKGKYTFPKTGVSTYMQPQNSLIVSLATGCLPGVIYNLDKARQIECTYAYCL
ncbi:hypothetical protein HY491_03945, partial [Candidatus Woesearchaeota archaeon]|nr:hypothetical protein [Candidatus Woesearchaeota archaeon]